MVEIVAIEGHQRIQLRTGIIATNRLDLIKSPLQLGNKLTRTDYMPSLEQALLATSTASCYCTHKHTCVYCYYGNAHQFLAKSGPVKTGPT